MEKNKVYILTKEYNNYDQHGKRFLAWFSCKPSAKKLRAAIKESDGFIISDSLAADILAGGSRSWYNLTVVKKA